MNRRFPLTTEGYSAAKAWLQEVGQWEYVSTHGFSCDGWSVTETANDIYRKLDVDKEGHDE